MLRPVRLLMLGGLPLCLFLLLTGRAGACSVCMAGDPIFDAQGTTVQQAGDFSVFFQGKGWKKKSGLLPGEGDGAGGFEKNESQRLDLFLGWTPFDRFTVTLDLPWAFNEITEVEEGTSTTSELSGFSDMSASASAILWRNRDVLPSTWFEGRALLKFPTGESSQAVDGVQDPHLQVGTGSWDFGFGLAAIHRLERASLYSSVFYRVNTEGSLDYEYGDVFLFNAGAQIPFGHALGQASLNRFTAGFELNFRYSGFDHSQGQRYQDSGGSILYLTPSLRVQLPWPWERSAPSLRAAVQIPATAAWLNGFQEEDPVWFAGLQYTF